MTANRAFWQTKEAEKAAAGQGPSSEVVLSNPTGELETVLTSSTPQVPCKTPQIPSNRDHKALNRATLGARFHIWLCMKSLNFVFLGGWRTENCTRRPKKYARLFSGKPFYLFGFWAPIILPSSPTTTYFFPTVSEQPSVCVCVCF